MSADRTYAAVHVADGVLTVLLSRADDVVENEHATGDYRMMGSVADAEVILGSEVVPSGTVLSAIFTALLDGVGAGEGVDVLEIACPAMWGVHDRRAVRAAVRDLARDVVMADASTAAVQTVGERTPDFAVVVELAELDSVVTAVSFESDGTVHRTGAWAAVGSADLVADSAASQSVRDRVSAAIAARRIRSPVDVFVVDASGPPRGPEFSGPGVSGAGSVGAGSVGAGLVGADVVDSPHRCRPVSGSDMVRAMAARAGISQFGSTTADVYGGGGVDQVDTENSHLLPQPVRSAAWLSDATPDPVESTRPRVVVLASTAVVVVAVLVAVSVLLLRNTTGHSSVAASPPTSEVVVPSTGPFEPLEPLEPLESESAPESESESDSERFQRGRAGVELPSTWTARAEADRLIMVPPDLPDRRIVMTASELRPGTSFDEVADELIDAAARRGSDSTLSDFTRATDVNGRVALSYVETPDADSVVKWQVFVEHDLQISIGCQSGTGEDELLAEECSRAVSTLSVTSE